VLCAGEGRQQTAADGGVGPLGQAAVHNDNNGSNDETMVMTAPASYPFRHIIHCRVSGYMTMRTIPFLKT
jgi:hypothetical protein